MKLTIKGLGSLCLMLALADGLALAQASKTVPPPAKAKPDHKADPAVNQAQEESPDLRKLHLRMLKESTLARAVDGIKSMDDAALRISARNQILTYLSGGQGLSEENRSAAARIASDAIADYSEHAEEISPFMAGYLIGNLGAWIQKHQPKLMATLQAADKTGKVGDESGRIRALLQLQGGDALAAQRIRQLIEEGREVEGLHFFLNDLRTQNPKEFELLLSGIIVAAERGQQVSFQTLFWISDIYLRSEIPAALKRRFLAMVVTRTRPANFVVVPASQTAYDLLRMTMPFIRELSPELYDQAVAHSFSMRAAFTERELAAEERGKRLKDSPDPVEALVTEAEATKSKAERNQLLAEAAQMALERKRFPLCLDVISKLDPDVAASSDNFWRSWADQFLKDFVKAALTAKDTELAERGAGRIAAPLARVEGLVLIMRYWGKANDQTAAQWFLAEASKIAGAASDPVEKAKAFLLLSIACDVADEARKADLLEAAVKALNSVSRPDSGASDKKSYQQYVRNLDNAGYQLSRGFKDLTKKDENGALALAEKLQKPDLRTFATLGVLSGIDDLLAHAK